MCYSQVCTSGCVIPRYVPQGVYLLLWVYLRVCTSCCGYTSGCVIPVLLAGCVIPCSNLPGCVASSHGYTSGCVASSHGYTSGWLFLLCIPQVDIPCCAYLRVCTSCSVCTSLLLLTVCTRSPPAPRLIFPFHCWTVLRTVRNGAHTAQGCLTVPHRAA